MSGTRSDSGIKSIQLTLDVIERIADAGEIGVTELATQLKSTKGTIYRHLQTLVERGYVAQNPGNSRYGLGIRTFLLGQSGAERIDVLAATGEPLKMLVAETGQSAVMSTVSDRGVVVMRTSLGKAQVEIGVRPGSSLAVHASSQGKVALAFLPALANRLKGRVLERFTRYTRTDRAVLEREISQIRARGWATAPEELLLGLNSVAAPVLDASGLCIATVAIVGSIQNIPRDPQPAQIRTVVEAGRLASRNLGHRP